MSTIADHILGLPAWVALLLVFLLPALEASVFFGIVFPGEIAVILGGVMANDGRLPLAAVIVAACLGAVIGDSVGYAVGRHYGMSLLGRLPRRLVPPDHVIRAADVLKRYGGRAVFVGRFTAAARALVPGMCGMSGMHYRTFVTWNVIGGVFWATGMVLAGYIAGASYRRVEHRISQAGYGLLALIAIVVVVAVVRHRRQARREARAGDDTEDTGDSVRHDET